jgi:hypothetical protein
MRPAIDRLATHSPAVGRTVARDTSGGRALVLRTWPVLVTSCLLAGATALAVSYGIRATTWAVMTDELQVARLATSIAERLSPVPTIHGTYYGAHGQLYPLLLAPLYGTLAPPEAATVAHALNAFLLVSATVPAFLLARSVSGSDAAGYLAAALTGVTPWLVLSSTLLTENVAYAAFAWSVLLCQRAVALPSPGRDAAALAGIALAFVARTQLVVIALALPMAVVLHEIGYDGRRSLRSGLVRAARHRVLVVVYLAGLVVAAVLGPTGRLGGIVGNYVVPFEGDLLPSGFWSSAAAHVDQVALGVGVLPVVLSISWLVTTALHPGRREAHAFAALFLVLGPLLVLEVTSFDLRFTPGQFIQDRYLFYLVPLFAVGTAAWLCERGLVRTRLVSAAWAGAAVAALLFLAPEEDTVIFWASPAAAFRPVLADAAGAVHLTDVAFLQVAAGLSVLLLVLLAWRTPRLALAVTASALIAFGAAQAVYVFEHVVEPSMVRPQPDRRDWIDAEVPADASVALVPGGVDGPVAWWEAEFWNRSVDRELRVARGPRFTPFPADDVAIDDATGRLVGPEPSDYVVVSVGETRFGLATARTVATQSSLRLLRVRRPYRVLWTADGLTADGWLLPGRPVTIRLFGHSATARRAVRITLASSKRAARRIGFAITAEGNTDHWTVDPGGARPPVEINACIPAGGHVDVRLLSRRAVRLEHGRSVALHLERLTLSRPWPCEVS